MSRFIQFPESYIGFPSCGIKESGLYINCEEKCGKHPLLFGKDEWNKCEKLCVTKCRKFLIALQKDVFGDNRDA